MGGVLAHAVEQPRLGLVEPTETEEVQARMLGDPALVDRVAVRA
jgi:hypothetical protein